MREVWLNYDEVQLYVTTFQRAGEGQGNTRRDVGRYRQTSLIGQAVRPLRIETTHSIGLVFSWIIIQS